MADEAQVVSAKDFDPTELTKAFNDLIAAQKAGDDDDFETALKELSKSVDEALGTAPDKEEDGDKPDPFQKVADKYKQGE